MKLIINVSLPTSSAAFKKINMLFDEKIIKISADDITYEEDVEIIDAKGLILLPGGIDPHLHMLGEDKSAAQDLAQISKAALEGGWTTVGELSYHTQSPVFTPEDVEEKKFLFDENAYTETALWGHVDIEDYPYHAESAQELWANGVVGLALAAPNPNPAIPEISFTEIMDLFLDIYESDTAFGFQGYDHQNHAEYGFVAQMDAIKKLLRRMQENPIHIPRVSSFPTIEFINTISKRSDISFATCLSDLMPVFSPDSFTPDRACDFAEYEELLFELIRTNKIYLLSNCSSLPIDKDNMAEVFQGSSPDSLAYSYLWVLAELWKKRKVPLATCIKMTSENAAKRMGIYPQKGSIDPGSDADFVLYNPEECSHFSTPEGKEIELMGSFDAVYIRGEQVAGNKCTSKRRGTFLARSTNPKRRHNNRTWI
ncbi:MAG: amidohydrolase family protein [Candidatus Cloacimonetes bacterium]|nr:amidohydrolase family protein [Candidatus Cloacimonadota bacterium]